MKELQINIEKYAEVFQRIENYIKNAISLPTKSTISPETINLLEYGIRIIFSHCWCQR